MPLTTITNLSNAEVVVVEEVAVVVVIAIVPKPVVIAALSAAAVVVDVRVENSLSMIMSSQLCESISQSLSKVGVKYLSPYVVLCSPTVRAY